MNSNPGKFYNYKNMCWLLDASALFSAIFSYLGSLRAGL